MAQVKGGIGARAECVRADGEADKGEQGKDAERHAEHGEAPPGCGLTLAARVALAAAAGGQGPSWGFQLTAVARDGAAGRRRR
ncbi:hypothetical protein BGC_58780 [Burkholderia sp. 3C]